MSLTFNWYCLKLNNSLDKFFCWFIYTCNLLKKIQITILIKKNLHQHNFYLTLSKDANVHDILPTYDINISCHIPQQD
jgi:hypothetical protein